MSHNFNFNKVFLAKSLMSGLCEESLRGRRDLSIVSEEGIRVLLVLKL